jgi:hypothetical protein
LQWTSFVFLRKRYGHSVFLLRDASDACGIILRFSFGCIRIANSNPLFPYLKSIHSSHFRACVNGVKVDSPHEHFMPCCQFVLFHCFMHFVHDCKII